MWMIPNTIVHFQVLPCTEDRHALWVLENSYYSCHKLTLLRSIRLVDGVFLICFACVLNFATYISSISSTKHGPQAWTWHSNLASTPLDSYWVSTLLNIFQCWNPVAFRVLLVGLATHSALHRWTLFVNRSETASSAYFISIAGCQQSRCRGRSLSASPPPRPAPCHPPREPTRKLKGDARQSLASPKPPSRARRIYILYILWRVSEGRMNWFSRVGCK